MQPAVLLLIASAVLGVCFSAPATFLPGNRKQPTSEGVVWPLLPTPREQLYTNPYDYLRRLPIAEKQAVLQELSRRVLQGSKNDEEAQEQFLGTLATILAPIAVNLFKDAFFGNNKY